MSLSLGTAITLFQYAMKFGPAIKEAIDVATSNESLAEKIHGISPTLAKILETAGAEFFPKAAPALHIVGAVVAAFDPNATKWLQGSLNALFPTLSLPPPNLTVDGIYGDHTKDAVSALQEKLGLKVDGIAGEVTKAAIAALLAKLSPVVVASAKQA